MQYSLSNLNAFIILLSIGYSLYLHVEKTPNQLAINLEQEKENPVLESEIKDVDNSPIQLINQIKGYFYINPVLALSLAITLFSFVGIPPLVGFFAKQMILSSALDNGYVFMALIAILASVVSAYYYLAIVKQIFFHETDYILNPVLKDITIRSSIINKANNSRVENIAINIENIKLSSSLTTTISSLTLIILFFILIPQE
jgi:NADH-ubiquinone oxidoreductase chain 2